MLISACGLICDDCMFYGFSCDGCFTVSGKTFWAKESSVNGVCPLFDCSVNTKKLENCGACSELPCKKFQDLKDPNITEEQHKESIGKRIENLKGK